MKIPATNGILTARFLFMLTASLMTGACSSVGYYAQSISGHVQLLDKREKIADLLMDETLDDQSRNRLLLVKEIVDFAHNQLRLPDNGSYRHYVDTGHDYVVWNVFAAPELGVDARQWCHIFIGCTNYRGYFNRDHAINFAEKLERQGWDVYVGGVSAYSTLGWFRDPILNTMINRDNWALARLIFHELAHQVLFVTDDTGFNEAFADAVAIIGVTRWLKNRPAERTNVEAMLAHESAFATLALQTREALASLYASDRTTAYQQGHKTIIVKGFKDRLSVLLQQWQDERFRDWVEGDINNARLAAVLTYRELVPGFMRIYADNGNNMARFYDRVAALARCPKTIRRDHLLGRLPPQSCARETAVSSPGPGPNPDEHF